MKVEASQHFMELLKLGQKIQPWGWGNGVVGKVPAVQAKGPEPGFRHPCKKAGMRTGELAQRLRTLDALPKDPRGHVDLENTGDRRLIEVASPEMQLL